MRTWRDYLARLEAVLERGASVGPLPGKPPPGPARFYDKLLRALAGDAEALASALDEAAGRSRVNRYLAQAVAHRVDPARYPPPTPELAEAWRAFRTGEALIGRLQKALEALDAEGMLTTVLTPPAAALPLAAGGEQERRVPLRLPGWEGQAGLRFLDPGARPFEVVLRLPEAARPALAALTPGAEARLYYRLAHGGEAEVRAEGLERFPEANALVLRFPEFWLFDLSGVPQDERAVTRVVLGD